MRALGLADRAGASAPSAARGPDRIAAVASRMLAVQGQDWRSARWALGLRAPGTSVGDVHAAFNSGAIVRSWPVRGTIHVLAAEDIGWIQDATGHRVLAGAPQRRKALGISDQMLERLRDVSLAAIRAAGGAGIDRTSLSAAWTEAGIDWQSAWRYHLIWWLCQTGHAVFGPVGQTGEPLLVEAERWIPRPRRLSGDEALGELATRYARARGPVTTRDLAWWSGLTVRESRQAVLVATETGRIVPVTAADAAGNTTEMWVCPELLEETGENVRGRGSRRDQPRWQLLPAFDEHLLGYTDRTAQLAPEHLERIVPGRNGMFLATVVDAGRTVATWRRGPAKGAAIEVTALPGARVAREELRDRAERWARFHGLAAPEVLTLA